MAIRYFRGDIDELLMGLTVENKKARASTYHPGVWNTGKMEASTHAVA